MGRTCKGICIRYKAAPVPNNIRYEIGQKHCTFCGLFLKVDETRCVCCKAVLRTKSRGKKENQDDSFEINSTGKVEIKKNLFSNY